jgi:hypothetical protein
MNRLNWKKCGVGLGICVGLTAALFACSGDDSAKSSDAGGSGEHDASKKHDAEASDSSSKKEASVEDSGGGKVPTPLNLCTTLDSFWNDETRSDLTSWPTMILNGPPSTFSDGGTNPDPNVGLIGYINNGDCEVGAVFASGLANATAWQDQLTAFEYRFFGCADKGVDAGLGFELVPPGLYGMPFGPDDLALLGDWFVGSVIQAVLNQSANNPNAILTAAQVEQMYAEIAYQETLYPNIIQKPGFNYSTCPADAGAEAGGD